MGCMFVSCVEILTSPVCWEKGMAAHYIILTWRIQWTEEPGSATAHGVTKSRT